MGNVFFFFFCRVPKLAPTLVPTSRYRCLLKKDGWTLLRSISFFSLTINYAISPEMFYRQPVLFLSFSLSLFSPCMNTVFLFLSHYCAIVFLVSLFLVYLTNNDDAACRRVRYDYRLINYYYFVYALGIIIIYVCMCMCASLFSYPRLSSPYLCISACVYNNNNNNMYVY